MSDDLFLKIINREIEAEIVYETDQVLGFRDINPQAPVHVLVIPKLPIASMDELRPTQVELAGTLLLAAAEIARSEGLAENGYRVVINCGREGGQQVYHLHLHLLGGRQMQWPPG